MQLSVKKEEDKTVAVIEGRLDTVTSAELKNQLEEDWNGADDLELDFTAVEYISSAGLRLLVLLQRQASAGGHTMVVRNINRVVQEIFKVAGFNKALTII